MVVNMHRRRVKAMLSWFFSLLATISITPTTAAGTSTSTYPLNLPSSSPSTTVTNELHPTLLKDVYETIERNSRENSGRLKLEDFSWGIFSGTNGWLHGIRDDFRLQLNNETKSAAPMDKRKLNLSYEFTVPTLRATWNKSVCLGYDCAITIELRNAVFAVRLLFQLDECIIDHLAYLKTYENAKCRVSHVRLWSFTDNIVEATVSVLSRVLNTKTFAKIIKDNVNYGLLQMPLFTPNDVRRLCISYNGTYSPNSFFADIY